MVPRAVPSSMPLSGPRPSVFLSVLPRSDPVMGAFKLIFKLYKAVMNSEYIKLTADFLFIVKRH
eukprot:1524568-Pleurochrysis_carterae.AAC.1